jgi:hypothetical protein
MGNARNPLPLPAGRSRIAAWQKPAYSRKPDGHFRRLEVAILTNLTLFNGF